MADKTYIPVEESRLKKVVVRVTKVLEQQFEFVVNLDLEGETAPEDEAKRLDLFVPLDEYKIIASSHEIESVQDVKPLENSEEDF